MTAIQRLAAFWPRVLLSAGVALLAARATAVVPLTPPAASIPVTDPISAPLDEVTVLAPEPRYVAPTRRDRIGRIWAPVLINGRGPFRLVLDTGASHSGVIERVADQLGLRLDESAPVLLRGVTGSMPVPTIHINSLSVGDLEMEATVLPIVTDALGGAEGVLGSEGLTDKRVYIDFRHDLIMISRSRNQRAKGLFYTVPFRFARGNLLMIAARVGDIDCDAIIDTGAQSSIGNLALRRALLRENGMGRGPTTEIQGVTDDVQQGDFMEVPPIAFSGLKIREARVAFGEMQIFAHWKLTSQPTLLLGMDALGLLDTLIIDYHRHELQVLPAR